MNDTVEVAIPVDAETAAALGDARKREAVGRIISRMIRTSGGGQSVLEAMRDLGKEAERRGLTDQILQEELAAHKAETQRLRQPST